MQVKNKGILTPETSHTARQCLDYPNPKSHSHLPAAATGPHQPEHMCSLVEAENGQAKTKTTNTLPSPVAAWAREKETKKLNNGRGSRDFNGRQDRNSRACIAGCSIPGAGDTTNGVPMLTACAILTTVVRGRIFPTGTSASVAITPEVRITVISNIRGDAETVLKTFSDFRSRRSATFSEGSRWPCGAVRNANPECGRAKNCAGVQ